MPTDVESLDVISVDDSNCYVVQIEQDLILVMIVIDYIDYPKRLKVDIVL